MHFQCQTISKENRTALSLSLYLSFSLSPSNRQVVVTFTPPFIFSWKGGKLHIVHANLKV